MNKYFILFSLIISSVFTYDRNAAVAYAYKYWNNPNHQCGSTHNEDYQRCSPYSYWGSEKCNYQSHGGDCANFVSQCLIEGGHPKLKKPGVEYCRGWPCGVEPGAKKLGDCLSNQFHWRKNCGKMEKPPTDLQVGDVLIYHKESCNDGAAHAVLVSVAGSKPKITCHSSAKKDVDYTYMTGSHKYLEWLHYTG